MRTVVLFDIDGTLIRCHAAPRAALARALREIHSTEGAIATVAFGGKTDRIIVREALPVGPPWDDPSWDAFWRTYARYLDEELHRMALPEVLPGAAPLLSILGGRPDAVVALITGNIPVGARTKLARAGLEHHFWNGQGDPLAAYGHEAERKEELGAIARAHAERRYGSDARSYAYVVVGDTPADILCARRAGMRSVAVATGPFDTADLAAHAADVVLPGLEPTAAALAAIFVRAAAVG